MARQATPTGINFAAAFRGFRLNDTKGPLALIKSTKGYELDRTPVHTMTVSIRVENPNRERSVPLPLTDEEVRDMTIDVYRLFQEAGVTIRTPARQAEMADDLLKNLEPAMQNPDQEVPPVRERLGKFARNSYYITLKFPAVDTDKIIAGLTRIEQESVKSGLLK